MVCRVCGVSASGAWRVITTVTLLLALLITSHEPPSSASGRRAAVFRVGVLGLGFRYVRLLRPRPSELPYRETPISLN